MGFFDRQGPKALIDKSQDAAAQSGRSTSAIGAKTLPDGFDMGEIARMASEEVASRGHVDDHQKEPVGMIDASLAMLFTVQEDAKGRAFRLFDGIEDEGQKQFIARLIDRRHNQKDRRLTSAEVQKVRDICQEAGIKWPHDQKRFLHKFGPHKAHRRLLGDDNDND